MRKRFPPLRQPGFHYHNVDRVQPSETPRKGKPPRERMSSAGDLTVIASSKRPRRNGGRNLSKRDIKPHGLSRDHRQGTGANSVLPVSKHPAMDGTAAREARARRKARDQCRLNRAVTAHLRQGSEGDREVPTWEKKMLLLSPYFITDNDFISPARNSRTSGKTTLDSIKKITPPWCPH